MRRGFIAAAPSLPRPGRHDGTERQSVMRMEQRPGDAAQKAILEWVDYVQAAEEAPAEEAKAEEGKSESK